MPDSRTLRRLLAVVLGLGFIAAFAVLRLGLEYWSIEREEFDPAAARERIEVAAQVSSPEPVPTPIEEPDSDLDEFDPLMLNDLDFELQDAVLGFAWDGGTIIGRSARSGALTGVSARHRLSSLESLPALLPGRPPWPASMLICTMRRMSWM